MTALTLGKVEDHQRTEEKNMKGPSDLITPAAILSAVAAYAIDTGHHIAWDDAHIIDFESYFWPRKVKEAIWIKKFNPALNRDSGYSLSPIYTSVVSRQNPTGISSVKESFGLRKSTGVDES